jgi:hypothetical protein
MLRVLTSAPDPMLLPGRVARDDPTGYDQPALDPELVRVVRPGQSDDFAGLHVMQPLSGSVSGRHFLVPLPANVSDSAPELFGFFTYEIRAGHRRGTPTSPFWSTAQGRLGPSVVLDGVQHPPPWIDCRPAEHADVGGPVLPGAAGRRRVVLERANSTDAWRAPLDGTGGCRRTG